MTAALPLSSILLMPDSNHMPTVPASSGRRRTATQSRMPRAWRASDVVTDRDAYVQFMVLSGGGIVVDLSKHHPVPLAVSLSPEYVPVSSTTGDAATGLGNAGGRFRT